MLMISGLAKLTLLDYPGMMSATIFLNGCNFRCPFCHNRSLVVDNTDVSYSMDEVFSFLEKRKNLLEGVCITGGEPLLNKDLLPFIRKIKEMGYKVKIDTNGFFPEHLRTLVKENMVDYIAMDIKNSLRKYGLTNGLANFDTKNIVESIRFIQTCGVPYEFRTTVVREFHTLDDFKEIGELIQGSEKYFLQQFVNSGDLIDNDLHQPSVEQMKAYLEVVKAYVPSAMLRGL